VKHADRSATTEVAGSGAGVGMWQVARSVCCSVALVMLAGAVHAKDYFYGLTSGAKLTVSDADSVVTYPLTGSLSLEKKPGGELACSLDTDPQRVNSVGGLEVWLCIKSTAACRQGKIDCQGGSALGFDTLADSDIGSCSSQDGCKNKCAAYCVANGKKIDGSHCASSQAKCECRCIDRTAGPAGGRGVAQCYIGAHITLKLNSACTGAAVVDYGNRCFPMTTSSSTAVVAHADFSEAQIGPIEETGTTVRCGQLGTKKLVLAGQVPVIFNPPSSHDVILTLDLPSGFPTKTERPTRTPVKAAAALDTVTPTPSR